MDSDPLSSIDDGDLDDLLLGLETGDEKAGSSRAAPKPAKKSMYSGPSSADASPPPKSVMFESQRQPVKSNGLFDDIITKPTDSANKPKLGSGGVAGILSSLQGIDDMDNDLFGKSASSLSKPANKPVSVVIPKAEDTLFPRSNSASRDTTPLTAKPVSSELFPESRRVNSGARDKQGEPALFGDKPISPTSKETTSIFSKQGGAKGRNRSNRLSIDEDDDLLASLGLGDQKPAAKPIEEKSLFSGPSTLGNLSGSQPKVTQKPLLLDTSKLFGSQSPTPDTSKQFESQSPGAGTPGLLSKAKADGTGDEFVPSFLSEIGRRRRGAPPGSQTGGTFPTSTSNGSLSFLSTNGDQTSQNSKGDSLSFPGTANSSKEHSVNSKPNEKAEKGKTQQGPQALALNLPFLDPKPKAQNEPSPTKKESSTDRLNNFKKLMTTSKSTSQEPPKQNDTKRSESSSELSSLASIASLSPTDTEHEAKDDDTGDLDSEIEHRKGVKAQSAPKTTAMAAAAARKANRSPTKAVGHIDNGKQVKPSSKATTARDLGLKYQEEMGLLEKQISELKESLRLEEERHKSTQDSIDAVKKENASLQTKLEEQSSEMKKQEQSQKEQESKFVQERMTLKEKFADDKMRLVEQHTAEFVKMKEQSQHDLEKAVKEERKKVAELVTVEVAKARVEHEKEMARLKIEHLDEMAKIVSTADATRQIESLAAKMDQSSKFVDSMQQRLESDHSYSIKEREISYQSRERHLTELQRHVIKQQRDLDEERTKLQIKFETAEAMLADMKREQEEERRLVDEEKRMLEQQISAARAERDIAQQQLHRERLDFVRSKEAWALEKRRTAQSVADEQRLLAMEKAMLEARKDAIAELETEIDRYRNREESQIHADRSVLERDSHGIAMKKADLHREAAALRAEWISLEAEKSKLANELNAFQNGWEYAEKSIKEARLLHETALNEKRAAEKIHADAKRIMLGFETEKLEIEKCRKALEIDKKNLSNIKQGVIEERLRLANDRTSLPKQAETNPTNARKTSTINHEVSSLPTKLRVPTQAWTVPKPLTTAISSTTPSIPLFDPERLKRESVKAEQAKYIATKLEKFISGLKESAPLQI